MRSYSEAEFESAVVKFLVSENGGWTLANDLGFRNSNALDCDVLVRFVKSTQLEKWRKLEARCGDSDTFKEFCVAFIESVNSLGLIHVLHKGFSCRDINFRIVCFAPETKLNPETIADYGKNICQCVRQWHYSTQNNNSVDIMLAVNGIPVCALELKNQFTNQNVNNAVFQWKNDRDPNEPAFRRDNRILAFFAVDLNDVRVTTELKGEDTVFLPFNQGNNGGAGNPESDGYITGYLWEEVLQRDKFLEILQRFVIRYIDKKKHKDIIIFPRYHQLDAVKKIASHVKANGAGHNYLIQHSAGSGKSNSIAWAAYRLSCLHDSSDNAIFNSVIVVTDRRVLDDQLRTTLTNFNDTPGVLTAVEGTSQDLKDAINSGKRVITTTLQKFPVIYRELNNMKGKNFALIIDEAHSGQTGKSALEMKTGLADMDSEDEINEIITNGRLKNLSCFAFTATPKDKTLELFGEKDSDGKFTAFHTYSMRQAIEEKFILDVLKNYTCYKAYYEIAKKVSDNPDFEVSPAMRRIKKFVELSEQNISAKTEIIIETFMETTRHKINGHGKMMVVTSGRLDAVKFFQAMKKYCAEKNYSIQIMIAFSGEVKDGESIYTEKSLNGFSDSQTTSKFHDEGDILVVADKYQTGFDESFLHTMIIDKELRDVKAVQTLSRLNRTCEGKDDTFILDFVNSPEQIQEAFKKFYSQAELIGDIDPKHVYELWNKLREFGIYDDSDINEAIKIDALDVEKSVKQAKMSTALNQVVMKYNSLPAGRRNIFLKILREFMKIYIYLGHIAKLTDKNLFREYKFCCFLEGFLKPNGDKISDTDITQLIIMSNYGIKEIFSGNIELTGAPEPETSSGRHKDFPQSQEPETKSLDDIIQAFNAKFAGDLDSSELEILRGLHDYILHDEAVVRALKNNDEDLYNTKIFPQSFKNAELDLYNNNIEAYHKITSNKERYEAFRTVLRDIIYHEAIFYA